MSMPALGPGNGDVAYRMQGLRHGTVEIGLDESIPVRTIVRLVLGAVVPALIVWTVFAFLGLVVFSFSEPSLLSGSTPGDGLVAAGSLFGFVIFWTVLLSARVDEAVAEWNTLIEEQWHGADSAYAAIYGTLRRRGFPVAVDAVRVRSDLLPPEVVDNRLVIMDGEYRIHVTVFPYGSSLYLGWTMSRGRRGVRLLGRFLTDLVAGMSGRTGSIERMLRTERVRALREAVHAAVREGAEVAAQGVLVPPASAFGAEVPVRDLRVRTAPVYGRHPEGPQMPEGPAPGAPMPSPAPAAPGAPMPPPAAPDLPMPPPAAATPDAPVSPPAGSAPEPPKPPPAGSAPEA
ncbi:adhesin [Actinoplanes regularis]|uniref:Uncharacterized protein n=1 Tax=Actinoplanes regularis TaxID=52697 RepID=A0A239GS44_9ACTN|nr:adhesin [Actinoplanes regularis]GIE90854.1 hypothetical protein Are01nite_73340 [Actinoplanes regularis]SNS71662.1 hypothetical protein SAMN06264365_12234 [Actinoplanes regularis]